MSDIAFQELEQDVVLDAAGDPDDLVKRVLLDAVKHVDPSAGIVTRYFTTVEYVDDQGNYGIFNLFPADAPTWQMDGIVSAGGALWDRFIEHVQKVNDRTVDGAEDDEED